MPTAMFMPVVPQFRLVKQKEKHQTNQQRRKQRLRADLAFKRFGQQVHKSGGQQRARGQAKHVLRVFGHQAKAKRSCQPHAANASHQRAD